MPNFDETEKEPVVLPVKIPNILVNGAEGIAVGMATSIPPHNLGEVIDAAKAYMRNTGISTRELLHYLKGPDFPTGGIVCNKDDLVSVYETGSGKLRLRGKVDIEKGKAGKTNVVISEIPYTMIGMGISKFLLDVAALSETKKTNDIVDITNQSSKDGIRIVIELRKDADVDHFISMLYKKTELEDTFGVNMLAVADGRPETMGLKAILKHVIDFQFEVTTGRYNNLLQKEKEKREVQEGLIKACSVIDLIIEISARLQGPGNGKKMSGRRRYNGAFSLNPENPALWQSSSNLPKGRQMPILEMRLYKLIGLEIEALIKEHDETMANIYRYEDILSSHDSMTMVIESELDDLKKEFGRKRRTVIENTEQTVYVEKKMDEMDVCFLMDRFGYAKTIDLPTFERNKEAALAENKYVFTCKNTGKICIFTDMGQLYTVKAADLPFGKFRDKGIPIDNVSGYDTAKERIICAASQSELNLYRIAFVTEQAMLKIVDGGEFDVSKRSVAATKLQENDRVLLVEVIKDQRNMILQSRDGYFLRFALEEIPDKKKNAIGVRGMKLGAGDLLEEAYLTQAISDRSIVYKEKTIELNKLKLGKRDAKGVKVRV